MTTVMKKVLLLSLVSVFAVSCATENNMWGQTPTTDNTNTENTTTTDPTTDNTSTNPAVNLEEEVETPNNWDEVADEGENVSVHYEGTLEDGEVFDSSYERETPLEFTLWNEENIPGFEAAFLGMEVWEKKSITLSPEEAYWERSEEYYDEIDRSELADFEENGVVIEEGALLPTMYGEFEIISVDWNDVTVDMNHPLAGKTLNFDIELVEIK